MVVGTCAVALVYILMGGVDMGSYLENKEKIIEQAGEYLESKGFKVRRHVEYDIIDEDFDIKRPAQYQPYDYHVLSNKRTATVSVKIAIRGKGGRDSKGGTKDWRITTWTISNPPTFFLVWMPDHKVFIQIPGTFFNNTKGVRTIPQEYMVDLKRVK